ncbi:MAG: prephenate dehydratase domain-containing protein [Bacillota bacterium]|nr:prephenate dehydratase domain-containing protein [Bacillota bacterium]
MKKISTLGPSGTFSELAVKKYKEAVNCEFDMKFYTTIAKAFNSIGKECEIGVIPIENSLDGFVQVSLDLLAQTKLKIICEVVVPVQFAFVSNVEDISKIERVYAQFKTQGQCCAFLEKLDNAKIITTESNAESYDLAKGGKLGDSAIIPIHMLNDSNEFSLTIENVTDSTDNKTRFIVLSKENLVNANEDKYKTTIVVMDALNKPGILASILNEFSDRNINLSSIISRPTKKALGGYNFYMDIDGSYPQDENVRQAILKIREHSVVKVLGSYNGY